MALPAFAGQRSSDNLGPRTGTRSSWRRCSPNQRAGADRRRRGLQFATVRTEAFTVAGLVAGETTHLVLALGGTVGGGKTSGTLPLVLLMKRRRLACSCPERPHGAGQAISSLPRTECLSCHGRRWPRDNQPRPLTPGRRHGARRRPNVCQLHRKSIGGSQEGFVGPQPHCLRPRPQHLQRRSWWQLMASRGPAPPHRPRRHRHQGRPTEKSCGAATRGDEVGAAGGVCGASASSSSSDKAGRVGAANMGSKACAAKESSPQGSGVGVVTVAVLGLGQAREVALTIQPWIVGSEPRRASAAAASSLARTRVAAGGAGEAAAAASKGHERGSTELPAAGGNGRPTPITAGEHGLRHVQETYRPTYKSCRSRALVLLIVVATNTASVLLFSDAGSSAIGIRFRELNRCIPFSNPGYLCLRDLNVTEYALAASPAELVHLHNRLAIANSLVETLLGDRANASNMAAARDEQKQVAADSLWQRELTGELKLAVGPHKLPLGSTPNMRTEQLFPTLGQACSRFPDELRRYMNYEPGGECPSDELFAQRLMLKGCEPRPRRSILWDAYTCKNYSCLVNRGKTTGTHHYDCKDCFNLLNSQEKRRWTRDDGALSYSIDAVLAAKPNGTVRIGLDIGSGSGTFAARMQERGVTVVTTSMNFDGPFNSFIASRGLVPMHLSIVHRLPFFDGTLDIVHSMHVLSHWIPVAILEFALFDIYRVLRPGGLFWLDHFYCLGGHMNTTYVPMFDRIGFNKVRWNARPKLDRGIKFNEWYVSALLEKPST
ncbi:hypothetical protein ACQ4PT_031291 [Festuca glaucescens]